MKELNKIAVVMPVHNTGKYLDEALKSLLHQTFLDFRLICVDDASTDEVTLNLLKQWIEIFSGMEVVQLEKAIGAANARNLGLSMVQEEYVIFLDSDDIFEIDFLEKMYRRIVEEKSDVCICGFRELIHSERRNQWVPDKGIGSDSEYWLLNNGLVPWNKLCNTKFLLNYNIRFQDISCCNDYYYSSMICLCTKNISYIYEPLINYRLQIPGQISSNRDSRNLMKACRKIWEECKTNEKRMTRKQIIVLILNGVVGEISKCRDKQKNGETLERAIQFLKDSAQEVHVNYVVDQVVADMIQGKYNLDNIADIFSYENQMKMYSRELRERLIGAQRIVLWGCGKRGTAFQRLCKENNIELFAVTDRVNCNIGDENMFGNKIISTSDALLYADRLIASNQNIYNELKEMTDDLDIVDLQYYCPVY